MNKKQAFDALANAGGVRAARIITANSPMFVIPAKAGTTAHSWWVYWTAWRLRRGMPVAKIINQKWFYGLPFYTNCSTLDPRPDSETLVEAVIKEPKAQSPKPTVLDLGTGTGNLICSIVKNFPNATGVGIDKSWRACRVARKNVRDLGLSDKIKIVRSDFYSNFESRISNFDIIISNPPYIAKGDKRVDQGAKFDPKMALYAGMDGLDAYRAMAKNAKSWLKPGGRIYLEIGIGMGDDVREIFTQNDWKFIKSFNDLAGIERVLEFTNPPYK